MYIYIRIKSLDVDKKFHSNNKNVGLKLENILSQEILKNQKVSQNKDYILIARVIFYILYYIKN